MSGFEEETYSTIFTSLKHPVRRKILRMLSERPRSFSEILEALGISSSHLTYHLENLGELVSKTEDGKYKLSKFGEAAVGTMSKVEETPTLTQLKSPPSLPIKWKSFFVVLMIELIALAGVSYTQYQSLNRISAEYEQVKPLKELVELMKKGAVCQSQYTLTYEYEEGDSWVAYTDNGGDWYCVIYSPYDNSTMNLALSINMIVSGSHVPISVQEGDVFVLAWNETAPVIWSLNATLSGKYSVPLTSKGWYIISLVGPLKPPTSIVKIPIMILCNEVDCWMSLRIIYEGNYSPFGVIA